MQKLTIVSTLLIATALTGCPAPIAPQNGDSSGDSSGDAQARKYPFFTDAAFVSAGGEHVLILKKDKTLWAVGSNEKGQLADGTTNDQLVPIKIMDDIETVGAGAFYTMIVKSTNRSLWAVGANDMGQLGDHSTTDRLTLVQVMKGGNSPGEKVEMTNVTSISAGNRHTMILASNEGDEADGLLYSTGENLEGQLGNGANYQKADPDDASITSIKPGSKYPVTILGYLRQGIKQVSTGAGTHTMIIKSHRNSLWGFGSNKKWQLGADFNVFTSGGTSTPAQAVIRDPDPAAPAVAIEDADYVSVGSTHTMLLKTDKTLHFIGLVKGSEGDPVKTSQNWEQITTQVKQVSTVKDNIMFIKTDDSLWGFGKNDRGQLGDGTTTDQSAPKKIMDSVKSVYAGYKYTYFIKTNGSLWAVGANDKGQLGDGTTTDRLTPVQVQMNAK